MGYRDWAIQNPTLTMEYKHLQSELEAIKSKIAHREQELEDAKKGILPEADGGIFGVMANLHESISLDLMLHSPMLEMFGTKKTEAQREKEREEQLIRIKKERYQEKLQETVRKCLRDLNGYDMEWKTIDAPNKHIDGYYETRDRLLAEIRDYNPAEHIALDWRDDVFNAVDQRLMALEWPATEASEYQSLINTVDSLSDWIDGFEFSLKRIGYRWIINLKDETVGFTRLAFGDSDELPSIIAYTLATYLESQWERMVKIFHINERAKSSDT